MRLTSVTFGADPELFIINEKTGKVVSAVGLIPGKKGKPYREKGMKKGFGIETDNILAEFNIPPTKDLDEFRKSILYMQDYIDKYAKAKNPDLGILCSASETVPDSELQSDQAKLFGCDVDYNVYTVDANPKPNGESTNLRSAGFHIHCGYKNTNIDTSISLIKYFDAFLGIPSILFDQDTGRRSLYGKAGCFRLTSYGVEYRVLSSAMMGTLDNLNFVCKQLEKVIDAFNKGKSIPQDSVMQRIINTSNLQLAKSTIDTFNLI